MNPHEIRAAFIEDLTSVAPDIDPDTLEDDEHLQDDLGLDSMDFLNLVSALHKRFGLPIPESDYPELATPAKAVCYLGRALAR
ncbi:MAG: acyl carrier protein [Pseudotabrizicola sp.]|uniref:acyl carrier protein n=1 Tax=Pseudotabrizicola sp. TaxID=2939647 RepID=UPI002722905B|nr:acyl carrier protein [Pseudotabrizicola sp.]MDO8882233.1 acyl carrier protein [Pseudotabrizicola sp.]MDP2080828.1 acyl carrier protein [Pseudotabrizicola sp.]MDZ7572770.1 acyl carrier protein [Pseudotabrizicola sp.]